MRVEMILTRAEVRAILTFEYSKASVLPDPENLHPDIIRAIVVGHLQQSSGMRTSVANTKIDADQLRTLDAWITQVFRATGV